MNAIATPTEAADALIAEISEIDTLRSQIDTLDADIARLVGERRQVSQRIQAARMSAGGTRVELGREREILDRYRTSLGSAGASLAEAVLRVCKNTH